MARKDFVKRNSGFVCLNCNAKNLPLLKGERNHCRICLYSLHVDEETPGDRKSVCRGFMEPVNLDQRGDKGFMILHKCVKCRKKIWNRAAPEDKLLDFSAQRLIQLRRPSRFSPEFCNFRCKT